MSHTRRFAYSSAGAFPARMMPLLPLELSSGVQTLQASGLLDTGATVNVLPYSVGEQLGFVWEQQRVPVTLSGNLARLPARAVLLHAKVEPFPIVGLAFAWTQSDTVRLILGQTNFFEEFDVCFFGSQAAFEIQPKADP